MNAQQIIEKIKLYPVAAILFVVALVMGGWTYYRQDAVDTARDEAEKAKKEMDTSLSNVKNGDGIKDDVAQLTGDVKQFEGTLVDPNAIIANEQYFYGFEKTADVLVVEPVQGVVARPEKSKVSIVPFHVNVNGPWSNIVKFLYQLESGPHIVRVTHFSLEKGKNDNGMAGVNSLSVTLDLDMLGK